MRAQFRGAKKLRQRDDPHFVINTIRNLSEVPLGLKLNDFPNVLVGSHASKSEILLRQFFLSFYTRICSKIIQSIGSGKSVAISLPSAWIHYLNENGVNCSTFWCQTLHYFSAFKQIAIGFAKFLYLAIQVNNPKFPSCPYVVFLGLEKNHLPVNGEKESYDIISWYKKSSIRKPNIEKIWVQAVVEKNYKSSTDLIVSRLIFPAFGSITAFFYFLFMVTFALLVSILGVLRGKWWYGFLFSESINLHYINALKREYLAEEYFYNNSDWLYKPLWTYEVEKKGSLISIYYYSTNIEHFQYNDYKMKEAYGNKIMLWNRFIVWDQQQMDYLKHFRKDSYYKIVGPIDFSHDSTAFKVNNTLFNIAIFDVTAFRPSCYTALGMAIAPYYSEQLIFNFLMDIEDVIKGNNINLLWKQKRNVSNKFVSPGYIKKRDKIINRSYINAEPSVSAKYIINRSDAVISMPFTSTAIIGKNNGLPSIYYDASGKLQVKESHEILVLKSKDELRAWFHSLNIEKIVSSPSYD